MQEKTKQYVVAVLAILLIAAFLWWYLGKAPVAPGGTSPTTTTTSAGGGGGGGGTTTTVAIQYPTIPNGLNIAWLPDYAVYNGSAYIISGLATQGTYVTLSFGLKASPGTTLGIKYGNATIPIFGIASSAATVNASTPDVEIYATTQGGYVYYKTYGLVVALQYYNVSGYNIWLPTGEPNILLPTGDVLYMTSLFPVEFNAPVEIVQGVSISGTGYLPLNAYYITTTGDITVTINLSP